MQLLFSIFILVTNEDEGELSTAIISEALGHSSEATTKAYLDKFEQSEIDSTFRHLI